MTATIAGAGTTEDTWTPWLAEQRWPALDVTAVAGRRVVVLAAHPDDEILGVAGLISDLSARGHEIAMVWATDGEASHPASTAMAGHELGRVRREESRRALARLAVAPVPTHHLGLPDGGLERSGDALAAELDAIVRHDDVVIAPWCGDGHPDHEAIGAAARHLGAIGWQYPIWMWHWAAPEDDRVPWDRVRTVTVSDVAAKAAAISMFRSQVFALGPHPEDAAILPPHVVARFLRSQEWIIT